MRKTAATGPDVPINLPVVSGTDVGAGAGGAGAGAGGVGTVGPPGGFANLNNGVEALVGATEGICPDGTIGVPPNCYLWPHMLGATARITDAANKSLPKENARLVKKVIGGLVLASAAAGATLTTIAYDTAKTEKNIVKKTLLYAAVLGNAALVVESLVQSSDLLGTPLFLCEVDDPDPGCPPSYLF